MLRKGQEKMVDSRRVKLTLQVDVDPLLSFVNKISIMELNYKISLVYIVRSKVNLSVLVPREGLTLKKKCITRVKRH